MACTHNHIHLRIGSAFAPRGLPGNPESNHADEAGVGEADRDDSGLEVEAEAAVRGRCCRMALSNRVAEEQVTMPFTAAVVQDCPVVFDRDKTLDKIAALTAQAAKRAARLVVFPESVRVVLSEGPRLRGSSGRPD